MALLTPTPTCPTEAPLRRWARRLGNAFLALAVTVCVAIVLLLAVLPRLFDYQTYVVLTGSMTPTIPVGSVVLVIPTDPRDIQVGDIISFTRWNLETEQGHDPVTVTHRVRRVNSENFQFRSFETQGDANPVADGDLVRYTNKAGKVVGWVPFVGHFFLFARSEAGRWALLTIPGVLFAATWLWSIWKPQSKPASESEKPAGALAPVVQSPFQIDITKQALGLIGDPSLTVERRFALLQPLLRRAERAGEPALVAWLEAVCERLIEGGQIPPASTATPVVIAPAATRLGRRRPSAAQSVAGEGASPE